MKYILLVILTLCVGCQHARYPVGSPPIRTREQQMKQLDRIEAKVTTILYEQRKKDTL
jgi:hypothetical protein